MKTVLPYDEKAFVDNVAAFQSAVHFINVNNGWYEENRSELEAIALMHSELGEATEYVRHGNGPSDHIEGFSGLEEEYADTIIRILDDAQHRGLNVAAALVAKLRFNATRGYRHGGKLA